LTASFR
jgi:mRNA-degrading endonuclease toxin of MazEF toxin-antitoxin module